jgi:hypothetical protein
MGRYYGGDIEGKFWFAVQSSNDPSFFHVKGDDAVEQDDVWECCGTYAEKEDEKCPDCTGEEDDEKPSSNKIPNENELNYSFEATDEQMEMLDAKLKLLIVACGLSEDMLETLRELAKDDDGKKLGEMDKLICSTNCEKEEDSDSEPEMTEKQKKALEAVPEDSPDPFVVMMEAHMANLYMDKKTKTVRPVMVSPEEYEKKRMAYLKKELGIKYEKCQARLYLGLRIEACLKRTGECTMWCEC